jgi:hypothetical protein
MKIMIKCILCLGFSVAFSSAFENIAFAWSNGPLAYRTGAPGDNGTCSADDCHNSFDLNSGSAVFSITGPDTYTPGKTIKVKISFQESSGKLHGFEMTALDGDGKRVGKFKSIGKTTQVIPPNDFRGLEEEDKGKYIEHTVKGNKKKRWVVRWKAPANATGTITFYAAGNEADGNGSRTGDHIYTATRDVNGED